MMRTASAVSSQRIPSRLKTALFSDALGQHAFHRIENVAGLGQVGDGDGEVPVVSVTVKEASPVVFVDAVYDDVFPPGDCQSTAAVTPETALPLASWTVTFAVTVTDLLVEGRENGEELPHAKRKKLQLCYLSQLASRTDQRHRRHQ